MRKILNIGAIANDGTGDKLRHAFDLSQQNFVELYSFFGDGQNITSLSVRQKLDTPTNSEVDQKVSTAIKPTSDHIADKSNPHGVTKAQVGLSNVDNTSDANKPISTETQKALDLKANKLDVNEALDLKTNKTEVSQQLSLKEDKANKGVANGYASLDENKKVPVAELQEASVNQKGITQLINDLTTGGTDKALTAEMGKSLLKMFATQSAGDFRYFKIPNASNPDKPTIVIIGSVTGSVTSNVNVYCAFPYVFPNTIPLVVVCNGDGVAALNSIISVSQNITMSGFSWRSNNSGPTRCNYIAIGD